MPLLTEMELGKKNAIDLEKSFKEACDDSDFVSLVKTLKLEKKEAMKKTSKLQNALLEKKQCADCKGLFMCKNSYSGHLVVPNKKYGTEHRRGNRDIPNRCITSRTRRKC